MVKYIDKGTAIKHLTDMLMKTAVNGTGVEVDAGELLRYIAEDRLPVWIDYLQIYELEEVMRGRWVVDPGIGLYCTVCGFDIGNDLDFMEYVNYCPHCGARMDLDEVTG